MTQTDQPTVAPVRLGRVRAYLGQCTIDDVVRHRAAFGAVTLQGRTGLKVARRLAAQRELREVDLDPAEYLPRPERTSNQLAIPGLHVAEFDWVTAQAELGLRMVRTAGGRIRAGDVGALHAELHRDYPVPVSVVLALDSGWLGARHFAALSEAVRGADRDVSLVLAAAFDPLDTAAKVANLRTLLQWAADSGRRLELLRTDLAGLPAITDGASATAIGLSTSTRHLGLPLSGARRGEYQQRQRSPLVFVPRLLHWQRGSTLGALSPWDGAGVTTCGCDACERADGDLLRFDVSAVTPELRKAVREHDALALSRLISKVREAENPGAELKHLRFNAAQRCRMVSASLKVQLDEPPAWLAGWD